MLVSVACLTYLRFEYYEESNVADDAVLDQFIQDGAYVLHDYVHSAWFSHLMDSASNVADTVDTARVLGTLRDFLDTRGNPSFAATGRPLMNLPTCLSILCRSSSGVTIEDRLRRVVDFEWHRNLNGIIDENRGLQDDPLTLSRSAQRIHERFDFIAVNQCSGSCSPACQGLHETYGLRGLFRCPLMTCSRHWNTFATKIERDDHLAKHQKQEFACNKVLCNQYSRGFKTKEELDLHRTRCPLSDAKVEFTNDAINLGWKALDIQGMLPVIKQMALAGESNLLRKLVPEVVATLGGLDQSNHKRVVSLSSSLVSALEAVVTNCPPDDVEYVFTLLVSLAAPVLVKIYKHPWKLLEISMGQKNRPVAVLLWEILSPIYKERGKNYVSPLSWAALRGHRDTVRLLLEQDGIEVNYKDPSGATALSRAAANQHEAVVQMLLKRDDVEADSKDSEGRTPLSWAAGRGHEAVVQMLLERDDVEVNSKDSEGRTPLSWAAYHGNEAMVQMLLEREDVEADSRDPRGRTPLSLAASGGNEAVVQMLLERDDVEADSKDPNGWTPLSWAANHGHKAVVQMLLERDDVKADSKDSEGRTPLSWAAKYGHEAVVKMLLERDDVKADSKDAEGRTPLNWAADMGHIYAENCLRVVRMLVSRVDVDPENTDSKGQTARQFAEERGSIKIAEFLHPDSIRSYRSQMQRENSAHDQLASEPSGHAR